MQNNHKALGGLTRRQIFHGLGCAAVAGLAYPPSSLLASGARRRVTVAGTVYEDGGYSASRSGKRAGIPDILVSNGRDVVLTDSSGRWSLSVDPGEFVFVIRPSQFAFSECQSGLPRFFHRIPWERAQDHRTPIDFALRRAEEARAFDVLLVADSQPVNAEELGYVRQALLAATRDSKPAFAIHHGDVMGDDLGLMEDYLGVLAETGTSWHHCPGNHDVDWDSLGNSQAFETWKRHRGPTHYAFQHGHATFILLNNVEYSGRHGTEYAGRRYRGVIGANQLRFVRNVLSHVPLNHLIVLSMHIPLVSFDNPESPSDTTADRDELLALLAGRPHTVSFSGHSHTTEHHYLDAGPQSIEPHHHHVLTAICGSWWGGPKTASGRPVADSRDGSPRGYHVLSVDGHRYETRFYPSESAAPAVMRVAAVAGTESLGLNSLSVQIAALSGIPVPVSGRRLVVDVFDGGPRTRVTCEFEGIAHPPQEMARTVIADPHVVDSFKAHRESWKPWVSPAVSSHIWTAPLPLELVPGRHPVVVRAVGEYGTTEEHRTEVVIEA